MPGELPGIFHAARICRTENFSYLARRLAGRSVMPDAERWL